MPEQYVALYLRISRADDASTSIAKQRDNARRFAASRLPDRKLVEFVDDGVSGQKGRSAREGLDRLFQAVSRRECVAVVVDTLDRIDRGRGAAVLWALAEECEKTSTGLFGASQDIDLVSSSGELSASIMAAAARYEARRTSDRVKATNAYRASLGLRKTGGSVVWGLKRDGDIFVPDPVTSPILINIIDGILGGTLTVRAAVATLTRDGVPTPRGGAVWSHETLKKILRAPALAGMTGRAGDVVRRADGLPWVHPGALLTVERWQELQDALDARRLKRDALPTSTELPLLHAIVHDRAGHRLYRRSKPTRGIAAYDCTKPHCDERASARMSELDDLVSIAFLDVMGLEPERERYAYEEPGDTARLSFVRAEIARTTASLAAAREVEVITELAARLGALRTAETEAEGELSGNEKATWRHTGRTLADVFHAGDVAERRDLLAEHIDRIVVGRSKGGGRNAAPLSSRVEIVWAMHGEPE